MIHAESLRLVLNSKRHYFSTLVASYQGILPSGHQLQRAMDFLLEARKIFSTARMGVGLDQARLGLASPTPMPGASVAALGASVGVP